MGIGAIASAGPSATVVSTIDYCGAYPLVIASLVLLPGARLGERPVIRRDILNFGASVYLIRPSLLAKRAASANIIWI